MAKKFITVLVIALLSACAGTPEGEVPEGEAGAKQLYNEAQYALKAGDYETAIQHLESLEARFPFSNYARQAQLDIAYAYYKYDEPESAIAAADRFIKLYPRHESVDYAYYLKGLVMFDKGRSAFDRLSGQSQAQRDVTPMNRAFNYFSELVQRFPDSKYAEDAVKRMVFLRNTLAEHEIIVARFYMKRGAWLAAANRSKHVVESFQRTPSVPEALAIMAEAYEKLGLEDLAADARRVLAANYPDHPSLQKEGDNAG